MNVWMIVLLNFVYIFQSLWFNKVDLIHMFKWMINSYEYQMKSNKNNEPILVFFRMDILFCPV